jgi:hypothetical protein
MSADGTSTDPGLSANGRKALRSREAQEAITDHERAQEAVHSNLERLRAKRQARRHLIPPQSSMIRSSRMSGCPKGFGMHSMPQA